MIIGGFSHVGTLSRPGASGPARVLAEPEDEAGGMSEAPTYFRALSSISPGSLAAAYQAIRAQEASAAEIDPAGAAAEEPAREPAILSGVGIPGALRAYGEVMGPEAG